MRWFVLCVFVRLHRAAIDMVVCFGQIGSRHREEAQEFQKCESDLLFGRAHPPPCTSDLNVVWSVSRNTQHKHSTHSTLPSARRTEARSSSRGIALSLSSLLFSCSCSSSSSPNAHDRANVTELSAPFTPSHTFAHTHTHTHTRTHTRARLHTHSLSLSLARSLVLARSASLALSLSLTHTLSLTLPLSLSHSLVVLPFLPWTRSRSHRSSKRRNTMT